MMRLPMAALTLSLSLFAAAATAECSREAAPAIPDGAVATLEDMKAAQAAVKAYMASGTAYLACLDGEGQAAGEEEAGHCDSPGEDHHRGAETQRQQEE